MAKISKNQLRRQKAKQKKAALLSDVIKAKNPEIPKKENGNKLGTVTSLEIDETDPTFLQFKSVFEKFQEPKNEEDSINTEEQVFYNDEEEDNRVEIESDDDEDGDEKKPGELSKRQQRIRDKIPLAILKAESARPEIVEWYDADAPDPRFLIYLKNLKNVVPVPSHWTSKREYLSNKRSIDRPPFKLPKFIEDTGISDMRDTLKDDDQTLKEKMRHRVQPQMGKLDLDYALLHNAFFHQQTKPKLYGYGEMYYEGKEFQSKFNFENFKPGKISARLSVALGIPQGAIPPWVPNMQKYGLPPSYPNLRVPGLNATVDYSEADAEVDKSHWASLEPESEDEQDVEDEEDEEGDEVAYAAESDEENIDNNKVEAIPITEYGVDLNKASVTKEIDPEEASKPLYQVLEQNERGYDLSNEKGTSKGKVAPNIVSDEQEDEDEKKFRF